MLKLVCCVRRWPDLTRADFDRYWFEQHAPLVRAQRAALGIRRYLQTVPLADPEAQERLRASCDSEPVDFDGITEVWYDNMESHRSARNTAEERRALQFLVEDERRFVDLGRSLLLYATERAIVWHGSPGPGE